MKRIVCWLIGHGKGEMRVLYSSASGIKMSATHCTRCGHCWALAHLRKCIEETTQ